jgi:hypothetical protein
MMGYGMPRFGNGAFADYVDATGEDPVPIVPPQFFGFRNPASEIYIERESGVWDVCPGQDNPSTLCAAGDVPSVLQGSRLEHIIAMYFVTYKLKKKAKENGIEQTLSCTKTNKPPVNKLPHM